MLAYASNRPVVGKGESSPNALLVIISVHVALLAAVMSSKVDVARIIHREPPLIKILLPAPDPQPTRPTPVRQQPTHITQVDHPIEHSKPVTDTPPVNSTSGDNPKELAMAGETGTPSLPSRPVTLPIRHGPELLTPASQLKPPYPASKLAAEQEATLRLALTIDERGRVIAVDPVGYADREFLDAARRYIIGHWRYQPATVDGEAISSNLTIMLRFQLDG